MTKFIKRIFKGRKYTGHNVWFLGMTVPQASNGHHGRLAFDVYWNYGERLLDGIQGHTTFAYPPNDGLPYGGPRLLFKSQLEIGEDPKFIKVLFEQMVRNMRPDV